MKYYQVTFEVPDGFVPEELAIEASYKEDIAIATEGFVDIESLIKEKLELSALDVSEHRICIVKFKQDAAFDVTTVNQLKLAIESVTGLTTLCILDDMEIMTANSAEAIDMLQKMINKINFRASIKIVK